MKRAFRAAGVFLLLLAASPVQAAGSVAAAKEHFHAAREMYKQGHYEDAIAEFRKAYRAKPHPVIYFNIGQCYEKLGDIGNALSNYREYLHQMPDADDRPTVEATLQTLEQRLKETRLQPLIINSTPSGARVRLDGEPAGTTPVTKNVKAGVHTVELALAGYEPAQRDVETTPEHSSQIDMVLRATAVNLTSYTSTSTSEVPAGANLSVSAEPARTGPRKRTWTWVALGAAGGLAAGGLLLGAAAQADANRLTSASTPWTQSQAQALYNGAHAKAGAANVCFGLSVASVITSGILFFVEDRR